MSKGAAGNALALGPPAGGTGPATPEEGGAPGRPPERTPETASLSGTALSGRPVRKIAFAYESGLPAAWMLGIQAFKRKLARAGVRTPVVRVPVEAIPSDADLVLVPTGLAAGLPERLPDATVVPLPTFTDQGFYSSLVRALVEAQAARPQPASTVPIIVTYRGEERIE